MKHLKFRKNASAFSLFALSFIFSVSANAETTAPNYHLVGWLNTFVPGAGQALLGDYVLAGAQATLEVSTFLIGYNVAGRSTMTLDGAPDALPTRTTKIIQTCKKDKNGICEKNTTRFNSVNAPPSNLIVPLASDTLQEFGIKYHMVNVYNSYREAAAGTDPLIDQTSTGNLFLAPFNLDVLSDPWVWGGLTVSAAALYINYQSTVAQGGLTPFPHFTRTTNEIYGFNNILMFPAGSGAPEEMFYRGFVQNEAYHAVQSPFFSIAVSTLAYTFSHSSDDRPSAAITGAYLGFLTHHNDGRLSKGIAYHFWADVFAGILQMAIVHYQQGLNNNGTAPVSFIFETKF